MEFFAPERRDHPLDRACLSRGLRADHGRAYDDLPAAVRDAVRAALVRRLEAGEILRARTAATDLLVAGASDLEDALRAGILALGTP